MKSLYIYLKARPTLTKFFLGFVLAGIIVIGWEASVITRELKEIDQNTDQANAASSFDARNVASQYAASNDPRVNRLMTKYHLSAPAAAYLLKSKLEVLGQTDTSVHYLLTFSDGVTSEETITYNPGQKYTPTPAEIAKSQRPRTFVIKPTLTNKQAGPKEFVYTLKYLMPESELPPEVLKKIHAAPRNSQASRQGFFTLIPSAWAQEGGGSGEGSGNNGGDFVTWNVVELTKSMDVKGLEQLELKKTKTFVDNVLMMRDVVNGYNEISNWLGEIAELKECAEHPTNPLAQKVSQSEDYGNQVIGGLDDASWEIQGTAFPKVANIVASALTQAEGMPFGAGVLISPIVSANDQAIEQFAEDEINNAKKLVVPCDSPMLPGNLRPMHLVLTYVYNATDSGVEEKREAGGEFDLNAQMGGLGGLGTGKFTIERKQVQQGPNACAYGYKGKGDGEATITAEGGGTPFGGVIELHFDTNLMLRQSGMVPNGEHCAERSLDEMRNYNFTCHFDRLDLVHGGTFSTFQGGDGHGTCTIDLTRK